MRCRILCLFERHLRSSFLQSRLRVRVSSLNHGAGFFAFRFLTTRGAAESMAADNYKTKRQPRPSNPATCMDDSSTCVDDGSRHYIIITVYISKIYNTQNKNTCVQDHPNKVPNPPKKDN